MLKGLASLCGCHFPSQSGGLGLKAEDGNTKKKKKKKVGEIRGNEKTKQNTGTRAVASEQRVIGKKAT